MEWVEVTGKTVNEAKEEALYQLGVAEADAEVVVVEEPRTGLFGRLRSEARVRARVRPVGPRPKRTRRPRERRSGGSSEGSGERRPREGQAEGRQPASSSEGGGANRSRSRNRRHRGGQREGTKVANGVTQAATAGASSRAAGRVEEDEDMAEGMTLEEQGRVAQEFLEGLLERYGLSATVETRLLDEDTVEVAADGSDLGVLVGPRGSTLVALQDVVRTVVQRQCPSRTDRILVDVAGYRERRAAALQRFGQQIAEEVRASGTERALEPMSPADRKVIHDTINEIEGVVTRSEGEEPARFVVIAPAP